MHQIHRPATPVRFVHPARRRFVGGIAALGLVAILVGCSATHPKPRVAAELPGYCEGVVFDAGGKAFVSVLHKETVFAIRESDLPKAWYHTIEPNGHKILPDGSHLIAAKGGVHHVDANGTLIEVLAPNLATPNDLALDGDGGVYITAPAESEKDRNANLSGVYYLDPSGTVRKVADGFCYPNGIVVRADGKSLLVNDSCHHRIDEFQISSPGVLAGRRVFAEVSDARSVPDGMTLDRTGRVYMADYGRGVIVVFDPSGTVLREYPTGLQHPSNVAFGGKHLADLFVTGSLHDETGGGRLIVLPLGVAGRSGFATPSSTQGRNAAPSARESHNKPNP